MTELPSVADVRDALCDVDFPASKEALAAHVERAGAPPRVVRAVRALPLGTYENVQEVTRSVESVEGQPQPRP